MSRYTDVMDRLIVEFPSRFPKFDRNTELVRIGWSSIDCLYDGKVTGLMAYDHALGWMNLHVERRRKDSMESLTVKLKEIRHVMGEMESLGYKTIGFNSFRRKIGESAWMFHWWVKFDDGKWDYVRRVDVMDENTGDKRHFMGRGLVETAVDWEREHVTLESLAEMNGELKDRIMGS